MEKKTWKDIFRITEEEKNTFDREHSDDIETYMQIHHHRIKPRNTTDFSRLDESIFYTRPITTEEIKKNT